MSDFQKGVVLGAAMVAIPLAWGLLMGWASAKADVVDSARKQGLL